MRVEDHNALRFILQEEIYLLDEDKNAVSTSAIPQPAIETPQQVFNYLGSNKKNFLILASYKEHEHMQDDHLTALESVLSKLSNSREDVAILNVAKHDETRLEQLLTFFSPKTIVILGQNALPAGADLKLNSVEQLNGAQTLLTFAFDEMMANVDNKKVFWEQMKSF